MAKIYAVGVGPGDPELLTRKAEEAAAEVAERVRQGSDVAFITIGDPFLYSTFLYLYRIFRERYPDIPVEVVPGISSVSAAAVAAGMPLGLASERIAIIPAAFEEDLRRTLGEFDTVVLMKVSRVFDGIYALLQELGLERNGAFISRVGSPEEEVVFDLGSLVGRKLDYLSLLIVKK